MITPGPHQPLPEPRHNLSNGRSSAVSGTEGPSFEFKFGVLPSACYGSVFSEQSASIVWDQVGRRKPGEEDLDAARCRITIESYFKYRK